MVMLRFLLLNDMTVVYVTLVYRVTLVESYAMNLIFHIPYHFEGCVRYY